MKLFILYPICEIYIFQHNVCSKYLSGPRIRKHWPWLMEMHLFYYKTDTTEQLLNKAGIKILATEKYIHYVSIHYLVGKIIAILPGWLEKPLNIAKSAMPQKIMIPISFGDIKLYICEKEKSIGKVG